MQFPMNLTDRIALTAVADDLSDLEQRAAELGLNYLALLLSHAREEAYDHLRDDTLARFEVRNPVEIEPVRASPRWCRMNNRLGSRD